ncbi:MAG: hypothetical protein DMF61_19605 [Blastocatellia bacterium AA13]|nr:MAG: hypothetical protein DMF61_19605 [Blastocatellia bacterium AA13]
MQSIMNAVKRCVVSWSAAPGESKRLRERQNGYRVSTVFHSLSEAPQVESRMLLVYACSTTPRA